MHQNAEGKRDATPVTSPPTRGAQGMAPGIRCWCGRVVAPPARCACGWVRGRQRRFCSLEHRRQWDRVQKAIARRRDWIQQWHQETAKGAASQYSRARIRFQIRALTQELTALVRELEGPA